MFNSVKGFIAGVLAEYGVSAINLQHGGAGHGHGHGHGIEIDPIDHLLVDPIDDLLVGGTGYGIEDFDVGHIVDDFYSY